MRCGADARRPWIRVSAVASGGLRVAGLGDGEPFDGVDEQGGVVELAGDEVDALSWICNTL